MKKFLMLVLCLLLVISSATVLTASEKSFFLTLAHNLAEDHAVHIAMMAWADAVNEKSDGSITINIIPNGQLGSEADCVSQIQAQRQHFFPFVSPEPIRAEERLQNLKAIIMAE